MLKGSLTRALRFEFAPATARRLCCVHKDILSLIAEGCNHDRPLDKATDGGYSINFKSAANFWIRLLAKTRLDSIAISPIGDCNILDLSPVNF